MSLQLSKQDVARFLYISGVALPLGAAEGAQQSSSADCRRLAFWDNQLAKLSNATVDAN